MNARLLQSESKIDIFRTTNIQESTIWKDNSLNLISEDSKKILDLSNCNQGLVRNFKYTSAENTQYAVPYGGEMRGMYVNVTLLDQLNLEVPTNKTELLNCCSVLLENGYIPFQSHYGTFGQQLMYPAICNAVVNGGNYTEMFRKIENIDNGISEYFRDEFAFFYEIVKKGYFDSNRVASEIGYTFSGNEGKAHDFFNVIKNSTDTYEKKDDIGKIAFMIDVQGLVSYLETVKSDYHSAIEYKFIASPITDEGGVAYLSPSDGLAINKNSDNTDWALEFLNFFFTPEITTKFAEMSFRIPNTKDALLKYDIDESRVSDVGQMTFSSYNFYKIVTPLLLGGYSEGYSEVNANYRAVYTNETFYRKVTNNYEIADANYRASNPTVKLYRLEGSQYIEVASSYVTENPSGIYYYKDADYYAEVNNTYISENPNEKIYRKIEAMVGISRMNERKYMIQNGDGTYSLKYTLDDYMARLEKEFQIVKATRDGA